MANIDKYIKQSWVNNSTKISAENLNKVETGLETLSEQTQQYVSEWADEWSTFKSTELSKISYDISNNAADIETAFSALSSHYNRLENLDTAVAGINIPVQTVSASVDAKVTTWAETNQTAHFDSVPTDGHVVKLDVSLSGSANVGQENFANKIKNKKRIPLYSFDSIFNNPASLGTGQSTCDIFDGTGLWSKLLAEQPGASWENITSDEEESLLGNPITALNNKLTFAVYNTKLNTTETTKILSTENYDSNIDCILIFYSTKNNKYYFANLNNLSIGIDLRFWFGSTSTDTSGKITRHLGIEQHHVDCEIFPLPVGDLKLMYIAFMTKTDHLIDIGASAYDYFNYLGDLYSAVLQHPYIFKMQGNQSGFHDVYMIMYTGTYYLNASELSQAIVNEGDFWYKIGNSEQGPDSNTDGPMASPNWSQYFSNAVITYKFTCPTGTSNAYKVLELCPKRTDDNIKQIAKRTLNDLISFGSDDPTSSTSGMFYFKTNNAD